MAVNKVILNGETLIDLTKDTVTSKDVILGRTFHLSNGQQDVGIATLTEKINLFYAIGDYVTNGIPQGTCLVKYNDKYYYTEGDFPFGNFNNVSNNQISWTNDAKDDSDITTNSIDFWYNDNASILFLTITGYKGGESGNRYAKFNSGTVLCLEDGKVYSLIGMGPENMLTLNTNLYNKKLIALSDIEYDTGD